VTPPYTNGKPLAPAELAERSVLGALLLGTASIGAVAQRLSPGDFSVRTHELTFRAMLALGKRGKSIEPTTVARELERAGELEAVGGTDGLLGLLAEMPPVLVDVHVDHVVDAHSAADSATRCVSFRE
jgi:replicative DNA helicase